MGFLLEIRLLLVIIPLLVGAGWFAYNYITTKNYDSIKLKWPVTSSAVSFVILTIVFVQIFPVFEQDDYKAYESIAKWAMGNGYLDIVEASMAKLIEIDPSNHDNWIERGKALMRLERFNDAKTHYSQMLEVFPESKHAVIGLKYANEEKLAP